MKLSLLPVGLVGLVGASASELVVTTNYGTLQGGNCASTNVNFFSSIPYAKPPIENLRFQAPQPFGNFGNRNATAKAPACPQFGTTFVETGPQAEDCLFLDVWVPANATEHSRLPVKVWLYGGSDETGGISNPLYDGCNSATDSILVSINYRVGPLGFLSLRAADLKGNFGIQDILLGLKWVKESITKFGGDPDHILLFGQSAGAFDTQVVASLEESKSLFSAAIMMSPGGDLPTIAEADAWSKLFVSSLNCSASDIHCLRTTPVASLQSTVLQMPKLVGPNVGTPLEHSGRGLLEWGPVIDGSLIKGPLSQHGVQVPSIFSSTTKEGTLFVLGDYEETFATLNATDYDLFLNSHFGSLASLVNATYPLSNFPPSQISPNPVAAAIQAIDRDAVFRCPTYRGLLGGIANNVPVFTYSFGHTPSCTWVSSVPQSAFIHAFLGPAHTSDIPFVFGNLDNLPLGGSPHNCSLTAAEGKMSEFMRSAWTNMAAQGKPGNGWEQFTTQKPLGVNFTESAFSVGDIDYEICKFWGDMQTRLRSLSTGGGACH